MHSYLHFPRWHHKPEKSYGLPRIPHAPAFPRRQQGSKLILQRSGVAIHRSRGSRSCDCKQRRSRKVDCDGQMAAGCMEVMDSPCWSPHTVTTAAPCTFKSGEQPSASPFQHQCPSLDELHASTVFPDCHLAFDLLLSFVLWSLPSSLPPPPSLPVFSPLYTLPASAASSNPA